MSRRARRVLSREAAARRSRAGRPAVRPGWLLALVVLLALLFVLSRVARQSGWGRPARPAGSGQQ